MNRGGVRGEQSKQRRARDRRGVCPGRSLLSVVRYTAAAVRWQKSLDDSHRRVQSTMLGADHRVLLAERSGMGGGADACVRGGHRPATAPAGSTVEASQVGDRRGVPAMDATGQVALETAVAKLFRHGCLTALHRLAGSAAGYPSSERALADDRGPSPFVQICHRRLRSRARCW